MRQCKLCCQSTKEIKDNKKMLCYYRCETCGFISLDEDSIIDSLSEKQHYEKHNNSFECKGYVEMFERFLEKAITPYCHKITTVLDFGCGHTPVLAELLKANNFEVDHYDLYFFPKTPYQTKKYDLIVSTEVFEHLKEPQSILETLVNSMNPKGYLTLMTKFPPLGDEDFLKWWYRRDITHISFFTPKSFEVLAKAFGLRVVEIIDDNIVVFQKI